GSFRGSPCGQVDDVDVVYGDVDVVLLAPFLRVGTVEPRVPRGNEVAPLENLQRLLLCRGARRKEKVRSDSGGERAGPCRLDELLARQSALAFLAHAFPPWITNLILEIEELEPNDEVVRVLRQDRRGRGVRNDPFKRRGDLHVVRRRSDVVVETAHIAANVP